MLAVRPVLPEMGRTGRQRCYSGERRHRDIIATSAWSMAGGEPQASVLANEDAIHHPGPQRHGTGTVWVVGIRAGSDFVFRTFAVRTTNG